MDVELLQGSGHTSSHTAALSAMRLSPLLLLSIQLSTGNQIQELRSVCMLLKQIVFQDCSPELLLLQHAYCNSKAYAYAYATARHLPVRHSATLVCLLQACAFTVAAFVAQLWLRTKDVYARFGITVQALSTR